MEGYQLVPGLKRPLSRRGVDVAAAKPHRGLGGDPAAWLAGLMADQDRTSMVSACDSMPRLAEIACPTLIVAGSNDQPVPIHHPKMLHDGITGSRLAIVDGADHALIWTHTDEFLCVTDEFLGT